ncbi:crossover junction endodeoxyribonuclease RuvC [Stomatohabitans albus]|uniref:crossover junction endodeoxyribonuclease RuvC n=1 Tax=Stomatohabitans albus TaxID=3110766 RepID=UPI00300C9A4A
MGVVIGIDPGLSRCGIAVLGGTGARPHLVASDVIRTHADDSHSERLAVIHAGIQSMARQYRPNALAVERIFINKQGNTGIGAVQVVGFVHLIGADLSIPVVEYTPSQVKAAVTGSGDADKAAVQMMVQKTLGLPARPTPADRADAMAVAICHLGIPAFRQRDPRLNPHRDAHLRSRVSGDTRSSGGMSARLAKAMETAGPGLAAIHPSRLPQQKDQP